MESQRALLPTEQRLERQTSHSNPIATSPSSNVKPFLKNSNEAVAEGLEDSSTTTHIRNWPTRSQALGTNGTRERFSQAIFFLIDLFIALCPLLFIALGLVWNLHGKTVDDYKERGETLSKVIQVAPTIYPIMFAAVTSRTLRIVARYKVEKGSTIGTLEQLMSSQKLFGAIKTPLQLHVFDILCLSLIVLWSLSPLGGQAALRLLGRENQGTSRTAKLRYLSTNLSSSENTNPLYSGDDYAPADSLYSAALIYPRSTWSESLDPWRNTRVPRLEDLDASTIDKHGWIEAPNSSIPYTSYTSSIGLPVAGIPDDGHVTFNVETIYFSVDCFRLFSMNVKPSHYDYDPKTDYINNSTDRFGARRNWTDHLGVLWTGKSDQGNDGNPGIFNDSSSTSFFMDTNNGWDGGYLAGVKLQAPYDPQIARTLLFGSQSGFTQVSVSDMDDSADTLPGYVLTDITMANCSLSSSRVESQITCPLNENCKVAKMRNSTIDHTSRTQTPFDDSIVGPSFLTHFPYAINAGSLEGGSTPTELVINDSFPIFTAPFSSSGYGSNYQVLDLSKVPIQMFSKRLSYLLNTYLQASLVPTAMTGDLPTNLSDYGPDTIWIDPLSGNGDMPSSSPFVSNVSIATVTRYTEIYTCNYGWLLTLFLSSGVLLIVGIAVTVAKSLCSGPDLLGYVSTLTRDTPFVDLPPGGSTLDGIERARLLKKVGIRLEDVDWMEETGYVAFASGASSTKGEVSGLKKKGGRLYA